MAWGILQHEIYPVKSGEEEFTWAKIEFLTETANRP